MKYVETQYEQRNLGVTACKFYIEREDDPTQFVDRIRQCREEYQEASVEPGNIRAVHALEDIGFRMMETIIYLAAPARELVIPRMAERFVPDVSCAPATPQETEIALEYIRDRGIFTTDKIALNPKFGIDKAGYRYFQWANQMLKSGCICYSYKYKGEVFGFDIVSRIGGTANLELGTAYIEKGAAPAVICSAARTQYWKNSDITKLETAVSSNNIGVLKTHEMCGLKVVGTKYILAKNCEAERK